MQLSTAVRPISAVKAHLTEIIRTFSEEAAPPVVITQNGEAKAVLMGVHVTLPHCVYHFIAVRLSTQF